MSFSDWLILAGVCLAGAMSPGPSLLVVVRTTLANGGVAGALLSLSHALAVGLYASLVVFGLAYLVTESPELMQLIRFAGAGFLLYLAFSAWQGAAVSLSFSEAEQPTATMVTNLQAIRDGFLTGLLNPKILFWFFALFSQFVEPSVPLGQKLGILSLAIGVDALWYLLVVFVLQQARQRAGFEGWIERHGQRINRCFALLLLMIAVRVLL